ncbi:MAG: radical SAM/SPASM domain-containing protein [bacterium]|nr:radical SAM/SPASM domain-containing protein [bacterium]
MKPLPALNLNSITPDMLQHWPLEYLRHLHLEMGQQCNVRCSMCYQTSFSPKDKLDDIVWKEKLLDAYAVIESITMQGGEPTVLPNCLELVRIITRDFPHVTLDTVTNGLMWNGEWEDAFLSQGKVLCLTDFDRSYAVRHRVAPVRSWQEMARPTGACPVGFDAMIVGYRGIVRPCCKSWYPFGDLMKSSLREVWSSRAAALFRGRMLRNDFRDCATSCDLNANPVNEKRSLARRGYWLLRREPDLALAKVKRKFGLSNAQVDLPVLNRSS